MLSGRAASIDAQGYARWWRLAQGATVHSVFERVVNLQATGGELFAVAAAGVDDAPDTVVADVPLAGAAIAPGEPVRAAAARLAIGSSIELALASARPWRAVLPAYPPRPQRLRRNLGVVRQALATARFPDAWASPLGRELAGLLAQRAGSLCAALVAGEREAARQHGQAMLGLGPGLTPSGDDFLAGLLVGLQLPGGPGAALHELGQFIVEGAGRRTNEISVAMLRSAAEGRVRECVIALLRELVAGEPRGVESTLARVLAIGSTSGSDMAAGILAAFDVQLQLARPVRAAVVAA